MAVDSHSSTVVITAECLCKKHKFSTEVPSSSLPLEGNVCHCDSCRHSLGAMFIIETTWPQPREAVDISELQTYQFSANITYRFCETCSTLMFYESKKLPSKLGAFSGPLQNTEANLIKLSKHIWVGDTLDGGASVWYKKPNVDGQEISRYREYTGELPWSWPEAPDPKELEQKQTKEFLPIWCHCKGIKLQLRFGSYNDHKQEELPWYIDPKTRKPIASFDACDSCRLQFGTDIVNWTFANLKDISQQDGNPFPRTAPELKAAVDAGDPAVGTLAYYQSSPDVERYFCRVCTASAFYACGSRPEIVDIAIGLLEAPDGARAESYLSWILGETPSWANDTKGGWRESLMKRIQTDAEEFRIEKNHPKSYRRLAKEAKEAKEAP